MRIALAALTLLLVSLSPVARADDDQPPPPHRHGAVWYAGWSMIATGGVSTLLGAALTTRDDSASSTTGWVLAGVGTATWIGGAVILRLDERRRERRAGY
ncbi:MAG: hypothetical protein ACXVCV_09370 [Polyangia bacterium]